MNIRELIISKTAILREMVKIPEGAPLDDALKQDGTLVARLGADFRLPPIPEPGDDFKFNWFLAEGLVRDASALLDRCVAVRKEYHELAAKWFEARIQVHEFLLLDKVTSVEEQNNERLIEQ